MQNPSARIHVLCCLIVSLLAIPSRAEDFAQLLRVAPPETNALLTVNVEALHASDWGKKLGLAERHQKAFQSGLSMIPPRAKRLVLAAEIDYEFLEPLWEVAVVEMADPVALAEVAQKHQGRQEQVAGLSGVVLPDDAYAVQLDSHVAALRGPANRQSVGRWVRRVQKRTTPALSPYLTQAGTYPDQVGTEIILAFDLGDLLTPELVEKKIKQSQTFAGAALDVKQLASILASLRGATLGVRVTNAPHGSLRVDFGQSAAPLGDFAQPLVLEVLSSAGAHIDSLRSWNSRIDGNTVYLSGEVSPDSMRKIFSLVEMPSRAVANLHHASEHVQSASETDPKAAATQHYYHALQVLLEDLKTDRKTIDNYSQNSVWFDRYARKIDQLPILNVDEELVNFGGALANALRGGGMSIKTMGISSAKRQADVQPRFTGSADIRGYAGPRYGRYGTYNSYSGTARWDITNVSGERRKIRADEKARAATDIVQLQSQIESEMAAMRRTLTQRYGVEF